MLLNSVVVFVLRRGNFRTLPLPKYKKNAPTIIYALSERWTRLSRDTDFSFTIEPTRCAALTRACNERETINRARALALKDARAIH